MMDITQTTNYVKIQKAIQGLMHELLQAQQHGDDVKHQIEILSKIITKMDLLVRPRPWEEIGIARSTYYRDLRRARLAGTPND